MKAREDLKSGDLVVQLWENYYRRARPKDNVYCGLVCYDCKKGEEVDIIRVSEPKKITKK